MSQGYRRKRKSHRKLVYLFLIEIIIILVLLFVLFIPSKVHRKVSVEGGAKFTNVELFLKDNPKVQDQPTPIPLVDCRFF
jgi:cell division septal protein FtsQ